MVSSNHRSSRIVHLVGSTPLDDIDDVFETFGTALPGCLKRIPDGEVGERKMFVWFQRDAVFKANGINLAVKEAPIGPPQAFTDDQAAEAEKEVLKARERHPVLDLKYDSCAISSYKLFCVHRSAGNIGPDVKFQVCLPTPNNVLLAVIEARLRSHIYDYYEASLIAAIKHIQSEIPHHDLAIQFDLAAEMLLLHSFGGMDGLINQIRALTDAIELDVELGFHLCYGDINEKHSMEPPDTAKTADLAENLLARIQRPISWIHMPVPIDRGDEAYFLPLRRLVPELEKQNTELYLGLVHRYDVDGTVRRMQVAARVLGTENFGIATECGLGTKNQKDFENILGVLRTAADTYIQF